MKTPHSITAQDLGISLMYPTEERLFRWFLACLLLGKPIQQGVAKRAYTALTSAGITSLACLEGTEWRELVRLLDQAHYVRYDFSTATKLLKAAAQARKRYSTITQLVDGATDSKDLMRRLTAIWGIGPVTATIFTQGLQQKKSAAQAECVALEAHWY